MKTSQEIEVEYTDLATWLATVADRLRAHGWSLVGLAREEFEEGYAAFHALHELCRYLERTAKLLDAASDRLCPKCGMVEVATVATFGETRGSGPGEAGRAAPKSDKGRRRHDGRPKARP